MEIKVLGPGCAKCNKTEKVVMDALAEAGVAANVEKVSDMMKIAGYGVLGTPAVVVDGEVKSVEATGDGPVDAAFQAIREITGTNSKLLKYMVNSITGGTDAQGEVTVRLGENGLLALGRGADPDIITASAKAYINGLNRLEYLKANPVKASQTL